MIFKNGFVLDNSQTYPIYRQDKFIAFWSRYHKMEVDQHLAVEVVEAFEVDKVAEVAYASEAVEVAYASEAVEVETSSEAVEVASSEAVEASSEAVEDV